MERKIYRTGGSSRHWLYDQNDVEAIPAISNALVHIDTYFDDEPSYETTLAIIVDKLLENLPEELRGSVSLVHLSGLSYRKAGLALNLDHKTVKARSVKGLDILRKQLTDTAWISTLLRGSLPEGADSVAEKVSSDERITGILKSLGSKKEEQ
jgi:DNA-directed RNA polymerase specialized sigma24 family protein